MSENYRIDDAPNAAPCVRNSQGNCPPRGAVGGHHGQTGDEETSTSEANANSLRRHDLPVSLTEARHHKAKDGEGAANPQHRLQIASIKNWSGKHANDFE